MYWPVDESLVTGRTRDVGLKEFVWAMEAEIRRRMKETTNRDANHEMEVENWWTSW